jgi:hypothetical protein
MSTRKAHVAMVIAVVAALSVPVAASAAQPGAGPPDTNGDGRIDYGEARAAGLRVPPLPADVGKRPCRHGDFARPGFTSAQAAEQSLAVHDLAFGEAGGPNDCYADPREVVFVLPPSAPDGPPGFDRVYYPVAGGGGGTSGCTGTVPYHRYVGTVHCPTNVEGGRDSMEIANPSLCHSDCSVHKHVYARAEGSTSAGNNVQIGWAESTSLPSGQFPLWVWTPAGSSVEYPYWANINLDNGAYYPFRFRHDGPAGAGGAIVVEFYNGGWITLDGNSNWACRNGDGSGNCSGLFATEVASGNLVWFNLNAPVDGEGINHRNIQLRVDPSNWRLFDPANFSSGYGFEQDPYSLCSLDRWNAFRSPRGAC